MVFDGKFVDELNLSTHTKINLVKDVPFLAEINCYGQQDPLQLSFKYLNPGIGLNVHAQFKSQPTPCVDAKGRPKKFNIKVPDDDPESADAKNTLVLKIESYGPQIIEVYPTFDVPINEEELHKGNMMVQFQIAMHRKIEELAMN